MKNTIFTGAGVAIITPMLEDGTLIFRLKTAQMPLSFAAQPVSPPRWMTRNIGSVSDLQ